MTMQHVCVFCELIQDRSKLVTPLVHEWPDAIALVPLDPCTPGHLMVLPKAHVEDATEDSVITSALMSRAVSVAVRHSHIITNAGWRAEQTIPHLHIHIIPRRTGDGLQMPWSWQRPSTGPRTWSVPTIPPEVQCVTDGVGRTWRRVNGYVDRWWTSATEDDRPAWQIMCDFDMVTEVTDD